MSDIYGSGEGQDPQPEQPQPEQPQPEQDAPATAEAPSSKDVAAPVVRQPDHRPDEQGYVGVDPEYRNGADQTKRPQGEGEPDEG